MKDTYFWHEVKNNSNIAAKNKNFPGSMTQRNWGYIGSGGIYSNVSDLYEFIKAVIESRLISKSNTERLFKEYYRTASGLSIGYGWYINDTTEWNTREIWTRGNEDWGHNAVIRWFPGKNKIIIVCTNSGEIGDKQITGNRIISNYIADFLWK
jgi:CubicO group peptidase (beta-lactamase class C family)